MNKRQFAILLYLVGAVLDLLAVAGFVKGWSYAFMFLLGGSACLLWGSRYMRELN